MTIEHSDPRSRRKRRSAKCALQSVASPSGSAEVLAIIHTVVIKPAKNKTQNKRLRRRDLGLLLLRYSYDKHSHCLQSAKQNEHKMLLSSIEVSLLHVYRLQESTKLFVTTFLADEPLSCVFYPSHDFLCSLITAWKRKSKTFSSLGTK